MTNGKDLGVSSEPVLGPYALAPAQTACLLVLRRLSDRLGAPGRPLAGDPDLTLRAARQAVRHAWLALEIALAGPPVWGRIRSFLSPAQGNVFRQQMDALLDLLSLAGLRYDDPGARRRCAAELRDARQAGLRVVDNLDEVLPESGTSRLDGAAGIEDPQERERYALGETARALRQAGYPELARLAGVYTPWGEPLFLGMVEYFLYRCWRAQPELARDQPDLPADHPGGCWRCLELTARQLDERGEELELLLDQPEEAAAAGQGPDREAVEQFFQLGLSRYVHGEYQQAAVHFTAALKIDPTDARVYTHRGDAYRLQCEYERAIADFHAALRLSPVNPSGLVSRAIAYHFSGEHERAVADCGAALEVSPNSATAYRIRAAAYAELGSADLALADLTTAITLAPEDAEAHHQRGVLYRDRRDYGRAVADFDRVLALNPHHVPTYLQRGYAHRCRGDHGAAVRDYSEVLRHHPGNVLAYTGRALAYRLKGDAERALADYTEVLRLEPDNARACCGRGVLYRGRGDLGRARADLDEALCREPKNWIALYHRSKIFLSEGRFAEALADLTETLALHPTLGVAYLSRAVIYDRRGQYPEGLADGTRAVELDARSPAARLIRGVIHGHMGNYAPAIDDLTEAIRLDQRFALAYSERSTAYTLQGEYDRALVDCNQLLALEPGNAQAYANRSIVYHFQGKLRRALVDYSRAMQIDPRCLMTGWTPSPGENARLQTTQRLADYIDGLRHEASAAEAPPQDKYRIVLQPPLAVVAPARPRPGQAPAEPNETAAQPAATEQTTVEGSPAPAKQTRRHKPAAPNAGASAAPAAAAVTVESVIDELLADSPEPPAAAEPSPDSGSNGPAAGAPPTPSPANVADPAAAAPARPLYRPTRTRRPAPKLDADKPEGFLKRWQKPGAVAAGISILVLLYFGYSVLGTAHHVRAHPAHGQVLFEGKPTPNANVLLEPIWTKTPDFPAPRAVVKDDGSFTLGTYGKEDGAPPGEYKVLVQWFVRPNTVEVEGSGLPRNVLPTRYGRFDTSGLTVRIQEGENDIPALKLTR